jgi:hypothetical protein
MVGSFFIIIVSRPEIAGLAEFLWTEIQKKQYLNFRGIKD